MIKLKWPKPGIIEYSALLCVALLAMSALVPNLPAGMRSVLFTVSGFGGLLLSIVSIMKGVFSAKKHGAMNGTAIFLGAMMLVVFIPIGWLLIVMLAHQPSSNCMTLC